MAQAIPICPKLCINKRINIRLTEKEKKLIELKAKKCNMTVTKYIISSCLKDNIIVIDGLNKVDTELRRIGNNINQLTYLANSGRIYTVDLSEVKQEIGKIWNVISELQNKL